MIVWAPSRGAKIKVPIDFILVRFRFGGLPTAAHSSQAIRMCVERVQLAQFTPPRQIDRKRKIGQTPSLCPRLEDTAGAAEDLGEREALNDVLGTRLLAINVFTSIGGHGRRRRVPVGSSGNEHGVNVISCQQLA